MALSTADVQNPVQVATRSEEVDGQAHGSVVPPQHDGRHWADETVVVTDRVILDVNDPLAVQVPEGVGASTAGHESPLGQALKRGTPEDQFAIEAGNQDKNSGKQVSPDQTANQPDSTGPTPKDTKAS